MRPPAPDGRILLLIVSPRVASGLLSGVAWGRLGAADEIFASAPAPGWVRAFAEADLSWQDLSPRDPARLVEAAAPGREVAWFGSPDGDPGLGEALATAVAHRAEAGVAPPEIEVVTGSYDVPGARILDLVTVMDRLRSPGGCPWDARQTHDTLAPYLLEETHELLEAIEGADRDHLVEELGDVLLQVAFHARLGEERPDAPFDIDDVAAGIVAKLVRRHPHVFAEPVPGAEPVSDAAQVHRAWEQLKAVEKRRTGAFDGIPPALPALARAQKMMGRLGDDPRAARRLRAAADLAATPEEAEVAGRLADVVVAAAGAGVDAEGALRRTLRRLATDVAANPS